MGERFIDMGHAKDLQFCFVTDSADRLVSDKLPELVVKIRIEYGQILNGNLPVPECESLLMNAFPGKLSRNISHKNVSKNVFRRHRK